MSGIRTPKPERATRLYRGALVIVLYIATAIPAAAQDIPSRLSDSTFWRMVTDFSEPAGYFRSDNLVSNEAAFQYVIPELRKITRPGGVYLGVGPDQNFTYVAQFQPKIAFIVDIRRGAMLQHLMYKALLEMSPDRADFLSRLFSRKRPPGLDTASTAEALFQAYNAVHADSMMYAQTLAAIRERLVQQHGFALGKDDLAGIEYVLDAFYEGGPDVTYNFGQGNRGFGGFGFPGYAQLQMETDGQGHNLSYIGSERTYRVLRELEIRNLLVPIVGDFAGPKALRTVGQYVRDHGATISFFYTSNVEQYLFQQGDDWSKFYANVSTLPLDSTSSFIRSLSQRGWMTSQNPNSRSAQLVSSIAETVKAFHDGKLTTYFDVIQLSHQ